MFTQQARPSRFVITACCVAASLSLPAARGQFTTVLDIPPYPNIGDNKRIASDTQVNLGDGGSIGDFFEAGESDGTGSNIEVNVTGGVLGFDFTAYGGSTVNISGGDVANSLNAEDGSVINVSGGVVGMESWVKAGSVMNITGGAVRGLRTTGGDVNISGGTVYGAWSRTGGVVNATGGALGGFSSDVGGAINVSGGEYLLNGAPIAGLENPGDSLALNLAHRDLLTGTLADGTPFAFYQLGGVDGISDGTLTLQTVALPAVGPAMITTPTDPAPLGIRQGQTLVVAAGGDVGPFFQAGAGSSVEVAGGQVGQFLEIVDANLTVSAGAVGRYLDIHGTSTVNISGGSIGDNFDSYGDGTTVNVSGGSIGERFSMGTLYTTGNTVHLSGGSIGPYFSLQGNQNALTITGGSLGRAAIVRNCDVDLWDGSIGDDFLADGAMHLYGGTVGDDFRLGNDSTLSVLAGSIGANGSAQDDSIANVHGGTIGAGFEAKSGSTVNLFSGAVGGSFVAAGGSQVNIYGGSIGDFFAAMDSSTVNLYGTQFILDGTDITPTLTAGAPLTITDRYVTLEGLLGDGTPFSFELNAEGVAAEEDVFDLLATLTVSLVAPYQPADVDDDGDVDGDDFLAMQQAVGATGLESFEGADANGDGNVDQFDFNVWRQRFGTSYGGSSSTTAQTVPEPAALALAALGVVACSHRKR